MKGLIFSCIVCEAKKEQTALSKDEQSAQHIFIIFMRKADIRNPLSLLAHERSRFATCQWELLTPTDISIPLIHRLVLYALEMGWGNAYSAFKNASHFCCEYVIWHGSYGYLM